MWSRGRQSARQHAETASGPPRRDRAFGKGVRSSLRGVPSRRLAQVADFPTSPPGRNQQTNMPYQYRGTTPAAGGKKRPPTGPEFMPICAEILRGATDVSDEVRDSIRVILWSLRSDRVSVNLWDRIGALPIEVRVEVAGLLVLADGRREQMLEQLLAEDGDALPVRNAEQDLRSLPEWACADLGPLLPGISLAGDVGDGRLGDNWLNEPEGLQDPINL